MDEVHKGHLTLFAFWNYSIKTIIERYYGRQKIEK